jgi:hypothetical protein
MRAKLKTSGMLALSILAAAAIVVPGANAALVTGSFVYRGGRPANQRQLHFENRVSHDMFIAPTGSDGTYSVDLPPGVYDLRAERGVILKSGVVVAGDQPVDAGQAVEPAPLDVRRPFEREGVGENIVQTEAPGTANLHGRPQEAMAYGHGLIQRLWGPTQPLPPIPEAAASPAAAPTPSTTTGGPNL